MGVLVYLGTLIWFGWCDTMDDIFMHVLFETPALSKQEMFGPFPIKPTAPYLEGIGMFALRGCLMQSNRVIPFMPFLRVWGVLLMGAKSVYAPRADGQAKAIRRAYTHAGLMPVMLR